jgi:hypothetical protein
MPANTMTERQRSDGERFTICNTSRCRKEFGGAVFSSCMLLQLTKRSGAFRWRVCHVLSCGAPLPIAAGRSWGAAQRYRLKECNVRSWCIPEVFLYRL